MPYRVFVSHGWRDRWIAKQMARLVAEVGATPFIDVYDIHRGDYFEAKALAALQEAHELVALLTPWSIRSNWVWSEIGAAWGRGIRCVGVLYGPTPADIEKRRGGLAALRATNLIAIDDFDDYVRELGDRAETGNLR
ncbi:MAG: TIR domain-containing protein [Roseiarcus sp.]